MVRHYRFPVAPQSYFNVRNGNEERERFLADDSYTPVFTYPPTYDLPTVEKYLTAVKPGSREELSLNLVKASLLLHADQSIENLQRFRDLNAELYREPKEQYVDYVLEAVARQVTPENERLWHEIQTLMGEKWSQSEPLVVPADVFGHYKALMESVAGISSIPTHDGLAAALTFLLESSGLAAEGWRVKVVRHSHMHARTTHKTKIIKVGELFTPRSSRGLRRIAVHEVYGHAMRGFQETIRESEGLAVFLEQLSDDRFILRRAYRYLAAALAWGYGSHEARNFREVYEIMWRVIMIRTGYAKERSKRYAFDECVRVFRGGIPSLPGAAYLKDSLYLVGNLEIWTILAKERLDEREFKKVITGERRILG